MTVNNVQSSVAGVSPFTKNHEKSVQSQGRTFTEDEIRAILPSIDGATVPGARGYALVVLGLDSGNRGSVSVAATGSEFLAARDGRPADPWPDELPQDLARVWCGRPRDGN